MSQVVFGLLLLRYSASRGERGVFERQILSTTGWCYVKCKAFQSRLDLD